MSHVFVRIVEQLFHVSDRLSMCHMCLLGLSSNCFMSVTDSVCVTVSVSVFVRIVKQLFLVSQ